MTKEIMSSEEAALDGAIKSRPKKLNQKEHLFFKVRSIIRGSFILNKGSLLATEESIKSLKVFRYDAVPTELEIKDLYGDNPPKYLSGYLRLLNSVNSIISSVVIYQTHLHLEGDREDKEIPMCFIYAITEDPKNVIAFESIGLGKGSMRKTWSKNINLGRFILLPTTLLSKTTSWELIRRLELTDDPKLKNIYNSRMVNNFLDNSYSPLVLEEMV